MHPLNHAQGRMDYLVRLVEDSIRQGHRFKAVRYYFMIRSCGVEIEEGLATLCEELCRMADSRGLLAARDQAQEWAKMVVGSSRVCLLIPHVSRRRRHVVLQVNGRRWAVRDKYQYLHEAFRPMAKDEQRVPLLT